MPVPGTTTPLPEPSDALSDAALPSASSTEMCVVPFSTCNASSPLWSARANAASRAASCASIASAIATRRGLAIAQEQQAERDQHAAARRRRVRAELMAPVLDAHRLTLDDFIRSEILQRERSATAAHMLDDSLREIARIEN